MTEENKSPFTHVNRRSLPPDICEYCHAELLNGSLPFHLKNACIEFQKFKLSTCPNCDYKMTHIKGNKACMLQCLRCNFVSFVVIPLNSIILPDGIHYSGDRCIFDEN